VSNGDWIALGLLLVDLALLAVVTAAEAGAVWLSRMRARSMLVGGEPRAEALRSYLRERHRLLGALDIARSLAIIAGVAFALFLIVGETGHTWLGLALVAAASLLVLTLLQATSRLLVIATPDRWGPRLSPLAAALETLFAAPAWLAMLPDRVLLRVLKRTSEAAEDVAESDELLRMMEIEQEEGPIEPAEREMIRGVINLEETSVHEIMVPRIDVVAVNIEDTLDDVIRIITERGYSRVPLFEETIDNIVGVVYAKDIIKRLAAGDLDRSKANLREIARPPFFVPESKHVGELLADMRVNRVHMAVVVDEYGGTAGIVTIEDMLEEIVGEIEDEYDREEPAIEKVDDTEVIVDARVSIDDLNELLGLHIEGEDFDTVGGFVYHELGRIPLAGDEVQSDGLRLRVLSVLGRRIKKIRVTKELPAPPPSNGDGNGNR
jgi:CBS domain containing-hemolysin-like protein